VQVPFSNVLPRMLPAVPTWNLVEFHERLESRLVKIEEMEFSLSRRLTAMLEALQKVEELFLNQTASRSEPEDDDNTNKEVIVLKWVANTLTGRGPPSSGKNVKLLRYVSSLIPPLAILPRIWKMLRS